MQSTTKAPFRVTPNAWQDLPAMDEPQFAGTEGFIADVYSNPDGSEMSSGYFELKHTDEPLRYEYTYDEMKVVLEGEFRLEDADTGEVRIARAKDAIFFPAGTTVLFSTPDRALAFYVGHRSFAP